VVRKCKEKGLETRLAGKISVGMQQDERTFLTGLTNEKHSLNKDLLRNEGNSKGVQ
jgi:hypothetical protein